MKNFTHKVMLLITLITIPSIAYPSNETNISHENNHALDQDLTILAQRLKNQAIANQRMDNQLAVSDFVAKLVGRINTCAQQLDMLLENITLDIHFEAVKVTNKKATIDTIGDLRKFLGSVKENPFVNAPIEQLIHVIVILDSLEKHISIGLKNNFEKFDTFTPNKQLPNIEKPEDIITILDDLEQSLKDLQNAAQYNGITWYNKVFRKIGDTLSTASDKYNVPAWTAITTLTALSAFSVWFTIDSQSPEWLKKIVGPKPAYNPETGILKNGNDLKMIGTLFAYQKDIIGLLSLFGAPLIAIPVSEDIAGNKINVFQLIASKVMNAGSAIKDFFVGAGYRNRAHDDDKSVLYDDVIGFEHAKEKMQTLFKYLEDPVRCAKYGNKPERGFLFYGPSRGGKSYFAKATYSEIKKKFHTLGRPNVPFIEIQTRDILKHGVKRVLDYHKQFAPCVLFIEEIDLLGLQRNGKSPDLAEFLYTLSGINDEDPNKQVILIATTNKPENLDFALRQKGRFGTEIYFEYPTFENRLEFLVKKFSALALDIEEFDLRRLAQETDGKSYEDIQSVIQAAFELAKNRSITLNQALLEECIDTHIYRIQKSNENRLSKQEKEIIATHQAAIALGYSKLSSEDIITRITIHPILVKHAEMPSFSHLHGTNAPKEDSIQYGRVFITKPHNHGNIVSKQEKLNQCLIHLIGCVAEDMLLNTMGSTYNHNSRKEVHETIKTIVFDHIAPSEFSKERREELFKKAEKLFAEYEEKARLFVSENEQHIRSIAQTLMKKKSISKTELDAISASVQMSEPNNSFAAQKVSEAIA